MAQLAVRLPDRHEVVGSNPCCVTFLAENIRCLAGVLFLMKNEQLHTFMCHQSIHFYQPRGAPATNSSRNKSTSRICFVIKCNFSKLILHPIFSLFSKLSSPEPFNLIDFVPLLWLSLQSSGEKTDS